MIREKENEKNIVQKKVQNIMEAEESLKKATKVMDETERKVQEYDVVVEDLVAVQRQLEEVERNHDEKSKAKKEKESQLQAAGKSLSVEMSTDFLSFFLCVKILTFT